MISIQTFKKALGEAGKGLSDLQIEEHLHFQYKLANAYFDWWLKKTKPVEISRVEIDSKVIFSKKNGNCITVEIFEVRWSFFSYLYA